MSDPDPSSSPGTNGRRRGLFSFSRKAEAEIIDVNAKPDTPHDIRLRLAEFEQLKVENVMVPRADIVAVEVSTSFDDLIKLLADEPHSRLPVYRETLDDPVGFVHIKDVVAEIAREGETGKHPLERLRRNVLYVPPSMKLVDLMLKMQSTRIHLALVVDEYGGTDGLVTLEDLVEEIVGDIEDEHDEDAPLVIKRTAKVWEADARTEIDDFAEESGIDLSMPDRENEIDTLGGVAFAIAGKIPVRGEILKHPDGCDIEILDADARRIKRLRIRIDSAAI